MRRAREAFVIIVFACAYMAIGLPCVEFITRLLF